MTDDFDKKSNSGNEQFDEAFIMKAVALSYARSWTNRAIAASLCIPEELYDEWIQKYSDMVKVHYLPDKKIRGGKDKKDDKEKLERCPECGADVIFDHVKSFNIQRGEGTAIQGQSSTGGITTGAYGFAVPFVTIVTETIERCPACGVYIIRNVTETLSKSEA